MSTATSLGRVAKHRLAKSNAELVTLAGEAIARHGRNVATPEEARRILSLAAAPAQEKTG